MQYVWVACQLADSQLSKMNRQNRRFMMAAFGANILTFAFVLHYCVIT